MMPVSNAGAEVLDPIGKRIVNGSPKDSKEKSQHVIDYNYAVFRDLVIRASDCLNKGRYRASARYAKMAAYLACRSHTGLFASPELEQILLGIGRGLKHPTTRKISATAEPTHVLHVLTQAYAIGGHTRLV